MKYVKMLGLLAVAAAALMAFAGPASAKVTSPLGTAYTGEIVATSTGSELDGPVDIKCGHSIVAGSISNGATTGEITKLEWTACNGDTATGVAGKTGAIRIDSNGTVYAESSQVTVLLHRTVLGFPVTTHCIYQTAASPGTDIGTLTEGTTSINLIGANIPQVSTDGACGSTADWTGSYTITKPGPLTID